MSDVDRTSVDTMQYLTFVSAGQTFGIPISQMREIVPYHGCTRVPLAPGPIAGLINIRGRAIPVLDLAVRFGAGDTPATRRSCVLIVDVSSRERPEMGILADSVSQVMEVAGADLEETPTFGTGVSAVYLKEMVKSDGDFIPIIDVETVLHIDASDVDAAAAGLAGSDARAREGTRPEEACPDGA